MNNKMYSALTDVEPVTERIIRATFNAPAEITIISVYALQRPDPHKKKTTSMTPSAQHMKNGEIRV
eukprot:5136660-Prorocentrum_lima.AAC.1